MRTFLKRVRLHSPFKVGQSIIIQLKECRIEITKQKGDVQVKKTSSSENQLTIKFKDKESFLALFGSRNLEEYGARLVDLCVGGKILMNPGPYEDPMKSGFHRFIGYIKKKKGMEQFCWVIPTF